jgi:uncharacterized protein YdcH (DUF465 family)
MGYKERPHDLTITDDPSRIIVTQPFRRWKMITDNRIAEQLRRSNMEFRELEEAHHRLDAELAELQKRHVLTPQEETVKKQIQKEKLAKKDKMAELIRQYREAEPQSAAH